MLSSVTALAPAKINLGLRVFPKRSDGYHDIQSVFVTVDLCDELAVSPLNAKGVCELECDGANLPEQNTVTLAYKAFCVLTGLDYGVRVSLKKRIPPGSGLGGGSSDASSFIQSISFLFGTKLSGEMLFRIAGEVGSDVFFFTAAQLKRRRKDLASFERFSALVEGRGESVRGIPLRSFYVLLVFPAVSVSTKDAYTLLDESALRAPEEERRGDSDAALPEMLSGSPRDWNVRNDFTPVICACYPAVGRALRRVKECGADFSDMSGSGSAVFGVFERWERAARAAEILSREYRVALC